jgi:ech hydrogenase subunit D
MIENLVDISKDQLLGEVQNMLFADYRFVTATCVDNGNGTLDIIYHFDKDLQMKHFKINVPKGDEIPSISKIYFCALLVENEMKELFGANITNIAIDYGGHMLLSDDELDSPMGRQQIVIEERKGDK